MADKIKYAWLICYIDSEQILHIEADLKKKKYGDIEYYIPLVKILKKQFKGKNIYESIPLLFNYGFFKIPITMATNREFLSMMRNDIRGIYAWVKDSMKKAPNSPYFNIPIAIAKPEEIRVLTLEQGNNSIYNSTDLAKVNIGDIVNLKGYPFDNIDAKILRIDFNKCEVKVSLELDDVLCKEVIVSFDNVFYSIYHGGYRDELGNNKSLDEMKEKNNGSLDKLYVNLLTNLDEYEIR